MKLKRQGLKRRDPISIGSKQYFVLEFNIFSITERIESLRWLSLWLISQTFINYNSSCTCSQRVETPQEAIQVLDIVLRATPAEKYTVVGRSFFSTELGPKGSLGEGLEYWRGFYQSLRPTQLGLSLNIDVSARSFFEAILVTEFLAKHFYHTDRSKHLPDRDCIKVKKTLKRVKVEVRLRDWTKNEEVKRTYTINGLSAEPLEQ
ncbi:putative post-transcriptional gene silencing PAZ-Argonaute family [Rosa chinensis]|uniref:Putative post-transcriptional gene silencing PAZ-Argonaute family n=1 Tax=Rosa chinensis TaxID=74649 RepID=A0A2P6QGI6_ROSCH|nr:putative post-transcriptional gene silencing PAZ-Argonaute family [Rosa chinensis]